MISCRKCTTLNSLDSAFCKRCGESLPEEDVTEARKKLEEVTAQGFIALNEDKVEEAMSIAETAVQSDPTMASAWSLKGMCFEQEEKLVEALECYEEVIQLKPDSPLDKIKVNQLRNRLVTHNLEVREPNRKVALLGGIAATVLMVAIGAVAAALSAPKTQQIVAENDKPAVIDQSQFNFAQVPYQSEVVPQNTNAQQQQASVQQPVVAQQQPQPQVPPTTPTDSSATLPLPTLSDLQPKPLDIGNIGLEPVQPPSPQAESKPSIDPAPNFIPPSTTAQTEEKPAVRNPGLIDIQISSDGSFSRGNETSRSSINSNGIEALIRTARSQYQTGNYSGAAASYNHAIKAGAKDVSLQQRLAVCYDRLGRSGDAVAAYKKAIMGYELALKSGTDDKDRVQSALDTCKQALKVLQGS